MLSRITHTLKSANAFLVEFHHINFKHIVETVYKIFLKYLDAKCLGWHTTRPKLKSHLLYAEINLVSMPFLNFYRYF